MEVQFYVLILLIIICCIFVVIFIVRQPGMLAPSVVYMTPQQAVQLHLDPLHVPFTLEVVGSRRDGRGPVVQCRLETERSCRVQFLWRVPFSTLGHLLNSVTAADAALCHGDSRSHEAGSHDIEAEYGGSEPVEDSTPQKNHYPVVAVVETVAIAESPRDVVALVAVIHLRDDRCSMDTCVLHRYVRQADGRVTLLQPLYAPDSQETPGPLGTCCVCQEEPASVVLLPCRHGCVCTACFARVDSCPMCRGRISQYFSVPPGEATGGSTIGERDSGAGGAAAEDVRRRPAGGSTSVESDSGAGGAAARDVRRRPAGGSTSVERDSGAGGAAARDVRRRPAGGSTSVERDSGAGGAAAEDVRRRPAGGSTSVERGSGADCAAAQDVRRRPARQLGDGRPGGE